MSHTCPLLKLPWDGMAEIDLSATRCTREGLEPWMPGVLDGLVAQEFLNREATALYGGYLERRAIYRGGAQFASGEEPRDIHLGIDFWAPAETAVFAPFSGILHSQADNAIPFDYGPTIILQHHLQGRAAHTLYGHLSRASLHLHQPGDRIEEGELIGWIGHKEENLGWPPHLHFQVIHDLEGHAGDYPGVAAASKLAHYRRNCPDPGPLVGLGGPY